MSSTTTDGETAGSQADKTLIIIGRCTAVDLLCVSGMIPLPRVMSLCVCAGSAILLIIIKIIHSRQPNPHSTTYYLLLLYTERDHLSCSTPTSSLSGCCFRSFCCCCSLFPRLQSVVCVPLLDSLLLPPSSSSSSSSSVKEVW